MAFDFDKFLSEEGDAKTPQNTGFDFDSFLAEETGRPSTNQSSEESVLNPGSILRLAEKATTGLMVLANPVEGLSTLAAKDVGERVGQLATMAGEWTAEELGRRGVNPYLAATAGFALQNAPAIVAPGPKSGITGRLLKAGVPASNAKMVQAASDLGVPLTRAEQTGSRIAAGVESMIEKTPLGSGPIQRFRDAQALALEKAKQSLQKRFGTTEDLYAVGNRAQKGLASRAEAMRLKKGQMFEAVPENVNIPLQDSMRVADEIIQQQSQYLPTTRNSEIIALAKDVQNASAALSSGIGVTGGPNVIGITRTIPGQTIPATTRKVQSSLLSESGKPISFEEVIPGKRIPATSEFNVKYSFEPEATFPPKPNFAAIKRLREVLNAKIKANNPGVQSGMPGQANQVAADYLKLKQALDADLERYVSSHSDNLADKFLADEFKESYRKANAFSGAYAGLFKQGDALAFKEAAPEKIVDMVFKKNNETTIKRFRALVGEDAFQPAKQRFTQDLLESPNLRRELDKYEPGTLEAIFTQPELEQIRKYASVQQSTKAVSSLQGTQGSARSNIGAASYAGLGAGLSSLLAGNLPGALIGTGQFLAPAPIARAYLALGEGIPTGISRGIYDASRRALISAYITRNGEELRKKANP